MKWEDRTRARLRRLRKTQKELADTVHYSPSHICDVLHGKTTEYAKRDIERVLLKWEREAADERRRQARRPWE
jgi:hypothetical protein